MFGLQDIGTVLASGQMIANKVRTDYDPVLSSCLGDGVERRRKEGGEPPVTTHNELLLCQEMTQNNGGGWGTFLEGGNLEKHVQMGKIATECADGLWALSWPWAVGCSRNILKLF